MGMSVLLVICINYRTDILYEFSVSFPFFFFFGYTYQIMPLRKKMVFVVWKKTLEINILKIT